ncbi:MAG: hypothetical protein AVDCRST_MAG88-2734, partial [uncultured Thermomicrobiales bacterium]
AGDQCSRGRDSRPDPSAAVAGAPAATITQCPAGGGLVASIARVTIPRRPAPRL